MGVRLAATFNTSIEFWLNAQEALDIYYALEEVVELPARIAVKKAG